MGDGTIRRRTGNSAVARVSFPRSAEVASPVPGRRQHDCESLGAFSIVSPTPCPRVTDLTAPRWISGAGSPRRGSASAVSRSHCRRFRCRELGSQHERHGPLRWIAGRSARSRSDRAGELRPRRSHPQRARDVGRQRGQPVPPILNKGVGAGQHVGRPQPLEPAHRPEPLLEMPWSRSRPLWKYFEERCSTVGSNARRAVGSRRPRR